MKQEDLMNELHKNTTANLEKSASDLSERDASRINAENLSILARQMQFQISQVWTVF